MLDDFVRERCDLGGSQRVELLYDSLRSWYRSRGWEAPNNRVLGANFDRLGYPLDATRKYRVGLTLKPEYREVAATAAMPAWKRAADRTVEEFFATWCEEAEGAQELMRELWDTYLAKCKEDRTPNERRVERRHFRTIVRKLNIIAGPKFAYNIKIKGERRLSH